MYYNISSLQWLQMSWCFHTTGNTYKFSLIHWVNVCIEMASVSITVNSFNIYKNIISSYSSSCCSASFSQDNLKSHLRKIHECVSISKLSHRFTDESALCTNCVSCVVSSLAPSQTAVWVNFFFWLIIGGLVIIQRRMSGGSKVIAGGHGGPAGGLFGEPGATASETEPIFNSPPRPQWGQMPKRNYKHTY